MTLREANEILKKLRAAENLIQLTKHGYLFSVREQITILDNMIETKCPCKTCKEIITSWYDHKPECTES